MLSNILLRHMDRRLIGLSRENKVTYSRYADDLAFSGNLVSALFIECVERIIVESGFSVNPKKKILITAGRRKILAGIDISSGTTRVPREYRRQVRLEAHLAIKLGPIEFIMQHKSGPGVLVKLSGKLAYWLQVEPDNTFAKTAFEAIREMCRGDLGTSRSSV